MLFLVVRNELRLHTSETDGQVQVLAPPALLHFLAYVRTQVDSFKSLASKPSSSPSASPPPGIKTDDSSPDALATKKRQDAEKDRAKCFLETLLTWLHALLAGGDQSYGGVVYQALLPVVLWTQNHPDPELAAIAKHAALYSSWMHATGPALAVAGAAAPADLAGGADGLPPLVSTLSLTRQARAHSRAVRLGGQLHPVRPRAGSDGVRPRVARARGGGPLPGGVVCRATRCP